MTTSGVDEAIYGILRDDSDLLGEQLDDLGGITLMLLAMLESDKPSAAMLAYIWKVCPWYTGTADERICRDYPAHLPLVQLARKLAKHWGYTSLALFDSACRQAWQEVCNRDS